jgi:hypothetical protein
LNRERLLPEIEAADAMLSRFEVFEQIAAGGLQRRLRENLSTAGIRGFPGVSRR